jgi:hypothetical protein
MLDLADRLLAFEESRYELSEEEFFALFQDLVDTGMILHLQGSYQRVAQALIGVGAIKEPGGGS